MQKRFYVGYRNGMLVREVIRVTPDQAKTKEAVTAETGTEYQALVGPFRTDAGAQTMAESFGPKIQTVADAERYSKLLVN